MLTTEKILELREWVLRAGNAMDSEWNCPEDITKSELVVDIIDQYLAFIHMGEEMETQDGTLIGIEHGPEIIVPVKDFSFLSEQLNKQLNNSK
jgi:hypothetical protein